MGVAGVLGLGGLGAWYFQETLKRLLPAPLRTARWLRTRDIVASEGTHFTILIADLDGDDEHMRQTKHVEAALRDQRGLEVVLVGPGRSHWRAEVGPSTRSGLRIKGARLSPATTATF